MENIRRAAEVAKLMVDAGLIVLVSFISPFRAERAGARALLNDGEFLEAFVDTPLAQAEARDVKGLHKKTRSRRRTWSWRPYAAAELSTRTEGTIAMPGAASRARLPIRPARGCNARRFASLVWFGRASNDWRKLARCTNHFHA